MRVIIAGDFCPGKRVLSLLKEGKFEYVLGQVKDLLVNADYSIVNLECPIVNYGGEPIRKCGPHLSCSEEGVEAIQLAGFNGVTLANNHFLDYGEKGVVNTLEACQKYGLDYVGGGQDLEDASQTLYKEINGEKLAIINCCEHEFSIATKTSAGSNPLNIIQQYYAIQEAKMKADYVLVVVHGGHEMWQLPSTRMQDTYRFFIDAGADVVVNHHQHCFSGYELYHNKPIFYGIGNFCFEKICSSVEDLWYQGYLVEIIFENNRLTFKLHPYRQLAEVPIVELLPHDIYSKELQTLNSIISDSQELLKLNKNYYKKSAKTISSMFEPIQNRYLNALQRKGWFPSLIFEKRLLWFTNYINCESHFEKIRYFIENG